MAANSLRGDAQLGLKRDLVGMVSCSWFGFVGINRVLCTCGLHILLSQEMTFTPG